MKMISKLSVVSAMMFFFFFSAASVSAQKKGPPGGMLPIDSQLGLSWAYLKGEIKLDGPAVTYTGKPFKMRASTYVSKAFKPLVALQMGSNRILAETTNDKIKIRNYWGGTLHGAREGFKAARTGLTTYTNAMSGWHAGSFNLMQALTLPLIYPNGPVAAMVSEELYPKYYKKEYEKMGVYLASLMMSPTSHLLSKKPIRSLEDLKGKKIGGGMGGIMAETIKALGAVPVIVPGPEGYTAFQRGLIDVFIGHDAYFMMFRIFEIGKYRTEVGLWTGGIENGLNTKFFDGLPADLKTRLYNYYRVESQLYSQMLFEREGERSRLIMKKVGIETIVLPPEERQRWIDAVRPVIDGFIERNEAKGLPARQLVADMQRLSKKYSTMSWNDLLQRTIDKPIQGIIDY